MDAPNPFDDPAQVLVILRNAQGQCSLWPEDMACPAGWTPVFGPALRPACDDWLKAHWRDIHPVVASPS
ncbi:MbtH family NRPS accessory protein [Pseudomonas oryzihabitans]|uniref:MbtH family protein n=1 Tax=Pseudomonas oryzihabitans TaxID=47885 RepID=UPI0028962257|nr:MbtH family NRPS accessory protein [Pseudomonas oryzihabitans]MDT3717945.1 MbtH family NRPS accessory protein [Pseudomonas oryzihabitans]